jgi:hypothetical protein
MAKIMDTGGKLVIAKNGEYGKNTGDSKNADMPIQIC